MHLRSSTKRNQSTYKLLSAIEALEERRLFSTLRDLPKDGDGWTVFNTPSAADGRKVYVSKDTDGNDNNSGLDSSHPVRSISKAKTLMRDGKADWMLLKRVANAETWTEGFGTWTMSGKDSLNPMLLGYYGFYEDPIFGTTYYDPSSFPEDPQGQGLDIAPRPNLNTGASADGVTFLGSASNIAVVGLSFKANGYSGDEFPTGLRAQLNGSNYLVEDCSFRGYKDNVVVANPGAATTDFTIRRSQMLDAFHNSKDGHAQGMYVSGSGVRIWIEENVFDHNGWRSKDVDDLKEHPEDKTVFNHNMYINTGATDVVVNGNIVTRGSLRGTLMRGGGTVTNNYYEQNAVAVQVGDQPSTVTGNVILHGVDLPSLASGVGIDVAFSIDSVNIQNNIVAHDQSAYAYNLSGINLNGGTKNATVRNNIVYDWRRALINGVSSGTNVIQDNILEDFDSYHPVVKYTGTGSTTFGDGPGTTTATDITGSAGNIYFSGDDSRAFQDGNTRENFSTWKGNHSSDSSSTLGTLAPFSAPNRDMATYNHDVAGSSATTFDSFIAGQRGVSRTANWYHTQPDGKTPYTASSEIAYIKAGFNQSTTPPPPATPTINVVASDSSASEFGPDSGKFTITRTGSTAGELTINYELAGSATQGTDYQFPTSTIKFLAGQSSIDAFVNPIVDFVSEGDETVRFNIGASTANPVAYVTGNSPSANVTISDTLPTVNVQAPISQAFEGSGTPGSPVIPGQFTLTRSGPTAAPLTVSIALSGQATLATDYSLNPALTATGTLPAPDGRATFNVTFPIGASFVDIQVVPIYDTPLAPDPEGDETVGLSLLPSANSSYEQGVSTGSTVTIYEADATPPPPPDDGSNPPPLGHGMAEVFYNAQDNFIPETDFFGGSAKTLDQIYNKIQNGQYGPIAFNNSVDSRPGFQNTGSPHSGVLPDHFAAIWTGQVQAQYQERYTFYLSMDPDAQGKVYIQDDTGAWMKVVDSGDRHLIGDANDDAKVNALDFNALSSNFGGSNKHWIEGDFNKDGLVDSLDFTALANNWLTPDTRLNQDGALAPSGFINLDAGVRYNVVIEYSDKIDLAKIRFQWSSESRPKQEVPLDRLYASAAASAPLPVGSAQAFGSGFSLFSSTAVDQTDGELPASA